MTCFIQVGGSDENGVQFVLGSNGILLDGVLMSPDQVEAFAKFILFAYYESAPDACKALCSKILDA